VPPMSWESVGRRTRPIGVLHRLQEGHSSLWLVGRDLVIHSHSSSRSTVVTPYRESLRPRFCRTLQNHSLARKTFEELFKRICAGRS
jgi:hypothetical protein